MIIWVREGVGETPTAAFDCSWRERIRGRAGEYLGSFRSTGIWRRPQHACRTATPRNGEYISTWAGRVFHFQ